MTEPYTLIGLGEVLWDLFESGKVLGGATANFACHAAGLGQRGVLLSRVGEDRLGDEIIGALDDLGVPTRWIQRDTVHPTSTVPVEVAADGTPAFTIVEDVAWDRLEADGAWLEMAGQADAVCFGTLAQRCPASRRAIRQVLDAAEGALKICDINFRQQFYSHEVVTESLAAADVLKLNDEEVGLLRHVLQPAGGPDETDFLRGLMVDYALRLVCVTLGAAGCRLITPEDVIARPVPATEVVDTVGSGDAFAAGLVVKLLEGGSPAAVAEAANLLGAYVAGHRGATPALSDEVLDRFRAL